MAEIILTEEQFLRLFQANLLTEGPEEGFSFGKHMGRGKGSDMMSF